MDDAKVVYPRRRRRGFTGAFVLITIGIVFLLNNFGILPWGVWETLWMFWPIFLIIWGLQLVLGSWWLGDLIIGIVTLAILAGILLFSLGANNTQVDSYLRSHFGWWPNSESMGKVGDIQKTSVTITKDEYPAVTNRLFQANVNTGHLIVEDADTTDHLILDSSFYGNLGAPELTYDSITLGYDLAMKLKTANKSSMMMGSMWRWGNLEYRTTIGQKDVPTTLDLAASTGKVEVSLDTQKLKSLNVDLGTGSAVIALGEAALPETLTAKAGTGSIEIKLPKDVGLKIKHSLGTGSIKINGQSIKGDGTDTYNSYDTATKKLEMNLELGTGSLSITTN